MSNRDQSSNGSYLPEDQEELEQRRQELLEVLLQTPAWREVRKIWQDLLEQYNKVLLKSDDVRKVYRMQGGYSALWELMQVVERIAKGEFLEGEDDGLE
jgi:hypothetical protein